MVQLYTHTCVHLYHVRLHVHVGTRPSDLLLERKDRNRQHCKQKSSFAKVFSYMRQMQEKHVFRQFSVRSIVNGNCIEHCTSTTPWYKCEHKHSIMCFQQPTQVCHRMSKWINVAMWLNERQWLHSLAVRFYLPYIMHECLYHIKSWGTSVNRPWCYTTVQVCCTRWPEFVPGCSKGHHTCTYVT